LYISTATAGAFYYLTGSFLMALGCIVSGVFIDVDHFFEFYLFSNEKFSPGNFINFYKNIRYKKAYVLLHSYEFLAVVWYFCMKSENLFFWGITVGYTLHLILDVIFNPVYWYGYSFLFRLLTGFRKGDFINEKLHFKKYPSEEKN